MSSRHDHSRGFAGTPAVVGTRVESVALVRDMTGRLGLDARTGRRGRETSSPIRRSARCLVLVKRLDRLQEKEEKKVVFWSLVDFKQ